MYSGMRILVHTGSCSSATSYVLPRERRNVRTRGRNLFLSGKGAYWQTWSNSGLEQDNKEKGTKGKGATIATFIPSMSFVLGCSSNMSKMFNMFLWATLFCAACTAAEEWGELTNLAAYDVPDIAFHMSGKSSHIRKQRLISPSPISKCVHWPKLIISRHWRSQVDFHHYQAQHLSSPSIFEGYSGQFELWVGKKLCLS